MFTLDKLVPQKDGIEELDTVANTDTRELLFRCCQMWENLRPFRRKYHRLTDYEFGRQWNDPIEDPDFPGRVITEAEYIRRQGKVPLVNNLIRKTSKAILGLYANNKTSSVVVARDRDEQKAAEMISVALQYAYQTNSLDMLDRRTLETFLRSGAACQCVRYKWDRRRKIYDIHVEMENLNRIFFNSDISDPRMTDLNTFGVLRDMTMDELLEAFARDARQARAIRDMYGAVRDRAYYSHDALDGRRFRDSDFYIASDLNKYRVIEVWTKESRNRLRVHDPLHGTYEVHEESDEAAIMEENRRRVDEYTEQGVELGNIPVMTYEWFVDRFWYSRYLTPQGQVLYECETPFEHQETPFTLLLYPLSEGEVHPFIEDFIDQQRYINRYITMLDFIRGASAKGVLIFPEEALGDNTKEDIVKQWRSPNGVIFAKTKNGGTAAPQVLSHNAVQSSDYEMIRLQMNLFDEVSGVHGALQGEEPNRNTPASLYAQQAQNASINLMDVLDSFSFFKKERDFKMIKVIQQFYDEPRYLNVAGRDYSEEAKWYNPDKVRDTEFDVTLSDIPSTPIYRSISDNMLFEVMKQGLIDLETYLENSSMPFADKILESIRRRKEEMRQGQAVGQLQTPEISAALQQGGNPQAMRMVDSVSLQNGDITPSTTATTTPAA